MSTLRAEFFYDEESANWHFQVLADRCPVHRTLSSDSVSETT